jgi:hypothetical protein
MTATVRYVANPRHVREVSLFGTADLAFWQNRLKEENLVPAERDGKAQLWIIAADMKFLGVRFRELSFSVLAGHDEQGVRHNGAYLAHAYHSSRLFAHCERTFFSTPYQRGDVRVSVSPSPFIHLVQGGELVFRAEMQAGASAPGRDASCSAEDGWKGPVFLPRKRRGRDREGRLFFAKIKGLTQRYPFIDSTDLLSIKPAQNGNILQSLLDSHFAGEEWAIREDATHARSRTYKKAAELFAGPL